MEIRKRNIKKTNNCTFFQEVKKLLKEGREVKISVVGESMRPFLREGDQVVLQSIADKELSIGQIVLALYRDTYVLHRVIAKKKEMVLLAGDANYTQIEYVNNRDVMAVMKHAYRNDRVLSRHNWQNRMYGMIWFRMRLGRRIYNKLIKR